MKIKIKINKYLKNGFIFSLVVLLSAIAFLIYSETKVPKFEEEEVALYSYKIKPNINYQVFMRPNILYNTETLEEDKLYLTQFVDRINMVFNYEYNGDKVADIKGDYEVLAVVEGYTTGEEKGSTKTIWKKEFILSPKEEFELKDKNVILSKETSIRLEDYNIFVNSVIENSKVNSPIRLTVSMNVNLNATTENGLVEEKLSPAITIPLNTNYFEIIKSQIEEKPGVIEETKQVQQPVNKNLVIIYSMALVILLIMLLCLIFLTIGIVKDQFTKTLNKIFKKHGSRLVALNSNIPGTFKDYNKVRTIEDLVRIADEVGKPILYKYSSDSKELTQFYVWDESQLYLFDLKEALEKLEMEKPPKDNVKPKEKELMEKKKTSPI